MEALYVPYFFSCSRFQRGLRNKQKRKQNKTRRNETKRNERRPLSSRRTRARTPFAGPSPYPPGWVQRVGIKNLAEAGKIFFLSQTLALCVVLSVASFKYVEVSLEQALSASTPAFTALLGVLILGKREKWRVWLTLLPVVGGAMVSAGGEPTLHVLGVTLIFLSNIMRATKSCMQELLLGRDAMDSLNLLRWMSVFSMTTLLPFSFILEGPAVIHERLTKVYRDEKLLLALLANCCGAFMTNLTQFMVTEHVGALSMQVLGNLKNVFTAGVSVFIFHNEVTAQGLVGYTITMLGAVVYHREKNKHHAGGDAGKAAAGGPSAAAPAMSGGAGGEGGGVSRLRSNIP